MFLRLHISSSVNLSFQISTSRLFLSNKFGPNSFHSKRKMEESISNFCKTLASFCNHLQSSCVSLKQSLDRRPIPLESACSTFTQCLNRRVSAATSDLSLLDSMSFGTVSFEELLGHCNQLFLKNESDLSDLQHRLQSFGYIPDEDELEESLAFTLSTPYQKKHFESEGFNPPSIVKTLKEDPLFEESLSLKNLGLSDACLATLAAAGNEKIDVDTSEDDSTEDSKDEGYGRENKEKDDLNLESAKDLKFVIDLSKDEFENLPSYLKALASWQDLLAAVEKMNLFLSNKQKRKGGNFLLAEEIAELDLGSKSRTFLLLLVRLKRLNVETTSGVISYRVL
ncbi:hypothetical protein RJ641_025265 [Dillenia turbinata]|uniref:Spindle and kinetochore-associated protein 3 n=1 Tax=Dillenia turbinata TaxID=194707 RepID=A0AAN8ZRI1_9MAGN